MARLMRFKEAEEAGIIEKDRYVAYPFCKEDVLTQTIAENETGSHEEQKIRINPYLNFTYQGATWKNGITLISYEKMTSVIVGGNDVCNGGKKQDVGEYFSDYAQKLDELVRKYYSAKKIGIAWCPQKDDVEGMSYCARRALNNAWLASPFVQFNTIYGLYYMNNGNARIETLYNAGIKAFMETKHEVAVGISLPNHSYVVVDNYNSGKSSDRPIMWINMDSDNLLEVYDMQIERLSKTLVVSEQAVDDLRRERNVIQRILERSGRKELLEGSWIF